MAPPKESLLSKYFYPLGFAVTGVGIAGVGNYYSRRPFLAGIQRHIALGIGGLILGHYVDIYYQYRCRERDAMIRHYIELHPEDFEVKKRKYKEIFDEWVPLR